MKQEINYTTNYNLFTKIIGNREINQQNIQRIQESVEVIGMHTPMMVNNNYGIIDGQHRLQVAKQLKIPISYYINSDFKEENIHELQVSKKWTALDFAERNASKGDKECLDALQIAQDWYIESKTKFSKTNILTLLSCSKCNQITSALKNNTYKTNIASACRVYNCIKILSTNKNKKFNSYSASISRILKSINSVVKGLDYKIIEKINKKHYLEHYSTNTDQTRYLIDLYNKYKK
tara:strand:- start:377 stop:1081 length:705 start_codon:yes stop_codon:yes gene_type:complete